MVNKERPIRLGVIGAGKGFAELMRPALDARASYELVWVADAKPESEMRPLFPGPRFSNLRFHQTSGYMKELPEGDVEAVLDFTPNKFHVHNLGIILEAGKAAYTEKTFAIDHSGIKTTSELLARHPHQLAYFGVYYRDEKGLGLRALTGEITENDWQAQFFKPNLNPLLPKVLDSIGDIEYIVGTCLEGTIYGSLVGREWLLEKDQGGMALDLGDHVFTFLTLLKERIGEVVIENARAGLAREAKEHYQRFVGDADVPIAETYVEVRMRGRDGFPIMCALGKYTGIDHRGFYIQGRHGSVRLDLDINETAIMHVDSPIFKGVVEIERNPKYSIIMGDFIRRVRDPSLQHQYGFENAKETLELTLRVKEEMDKKPYFEYKEGVLPSMHDIIRMYKKQ